MPSIISISEDDWKDAAFSANFKDDELQFLGGFKEILPTDQSSEVEFYCFIIYRYLVRVSRTIFFVSLYWFLPCFISRDIRNRIPDKFDYLEEIKEETRRND